MVLIARFRQLISQFPGGMRNLALTLLDGRYFGYWRGAIETNAVMLNSAELLQGPFLRQPGVSST